MAMRKLSMYNFLTLNGFYKGANDDISWHTHGGEEAEYSEKGAQSQSILLFGRKTYEMMYSFWPTPQAYENMPVVADGMNKSQKIVVSNTLDKAEWNNTTILKGNLVEEIKKLKQQPGNDITILGSGSIITQLADAGLIDNYQIMIDPVAIGEGTSIFSGISHNLNLKLTDTRVFKSGVVLLCYEPK
jgi:dihydrofolate reductase